MNKRILEIDIDKPRKARIWMQVLPGELPLFGEGLAVERVTSQKSQVEQRTVAALEVLCPLGAYAKYGLLVMEYSAALSESLTIEIRTCSSSGAELTWTLGSGIDKVRAGIPDWTADAILRVSREAACSGQIASGFLRFVGGAEGEVGSSTSFFGQLAKALIGIAALGKDEADDRKVVDVVRSFFW